MNTGCMNIYGKQLLYLFRRLFDQVPGRRLHIEFGNFDANAVNGDMEVVVGDTVDGRNPANQLIRSLSHYYLQGFIHARGCRISSINSMG